MRRAANQTHLQRPQPAGNARPGADVLFYTAERHRRHPVPFLPLPWSRKRFCHRSFRVVKKPNRLWNNTRYYCLRALVFWGKARFKRWDKSTNESRGGGGTGDPNDTDSVPVNSTSQSSQPRAPKSRNNQGNRNRSNQKLPSQGRIKTSESKRIPKQVSEPITIWSKQVILEPLLQE